MTFVSPAVPKKLGQNDIAQTYKVASQNYRHLFDAETGYMRARDSQGNFRPDFSPYSWGRDYAECSAIQATLGVLHDIPGLIQLMGGKETFSHYLLKACQDAPLFETTGYGYEIHEMSEMATAPLDKSPSLTSLASTFHISFATATTQTTLLYSSSRYVRKPFTQAGKPILAMRTMAVSLLGISGQLLDSTRPVQANQVTISEFLSLTISVSTWLRKINGWISMPSKTTATSTLSKNADWTRP